MGVASFPGRVGGEKTAWYPLLAQAPLFPVYFRKIVRFTLSFHVDHIRTEYSRSNLRTRSSQKVAAKQIRRSEGRPKYSAALFGDVGLCEDWRSRLCKLLLMSAVSVDSGDGLPAVPA